MSLLRDYFCPRYCGGPSQTIVSLPANVLDSHPSGRVQETSPVQELTFLSAVSMAEQIRRKQLSPIELVEAHLQRIEQLNPKLNAFVDVDAAGARRQAQTAERAVMQGSALEI